MIFSAAPFPDSAASHVTPSGRPQSGRVGPEQFASRRGTTLVTCRTFTVRSTGVSVRMYKVSPSEALGRRSFENTVVSVT